MRGKEPFYSRSTFGYIVAGLAIALVSAVLFTPLGNLVGKRLMDRFAPEQRPASSNVPPTTTSTLDPSTSAKVNAQPVSKTPASPPLGRHPRVQAPPADPQGASLSLEYDSLKERFTGGDVAEIPYTGDLRALLNESGCSPQDHPASASPNPTGEPKSAESTKTDHPSPPVGETKRIGQLEVKLSGCRTDPEGLVCSALVTNLGADRQYCLVSKADAMMSRIVDAQGAVSTPRDISLGEQRGAFQMWQCASMPSGVPVAASLHFMVWPGFSTRMPAEGERLKLVEFGFDLVSYASKSPTAMFAQFHDVSVTR